MPLRPFSATYFTYDDGDRLGFLAALLSLTPVFVMVSYATLIASRPDCHTITLVTGQLANEVLNYVLKHALKQPRPGGERDHVPKYGMPSNHAQFAFFAAVYTVLWAARRWQAAWVVRVATVAAALVGATAVCAARVYLGYHSLAQVGVGAAVGSAAAAAWYYVTELLLRPHFAAIVRLPLARALFLRNSGPCAHVLRVEYDAVMAAGAAASTAVPVPRSPQRAKVQ